MDINDIRSLMTVLAVIFFAGIVWWTYSSRRTDTYAAAALMPLEEDSPYVPQATEDKRTSVAQ